MDRNAATATIFCMKKSLAPAIVLFVLLAACQKSVPVTTEKPPAPYARWRTHHDDSLALSIDYPMDEFTVNENAEGIVSGKTTIVTDGLSFGDGASEGMNVHVYRTTDKRIMDYLQADGPLGAEKDVKGVKFRKFVFTGTGNAYGYVTQKGKDYYVLLGTEGPQNPVLERMLVSLKFDPASR